MFDVNEILAMLQNGENPDDIAQKALDAVNEAQRLQKEEEEKQARYEAEKALEAQKQMKMDSALDDMFCAAIAYVDLIDEKFADELDTWWSNTSDEEVDSLHASIAALVGMYGALSQLNGILGDRTDLSSMLGVNSKATTAQDSKKLRSDDEVIANFLSKMLG
jgi:hypothetical protein